jgi:hypothetical protein
MNINYKIYENFDRRQNNQSVDNDRRSGYDRRFMARLDDKTRNDIDTVMRLIPPLRKLHSATEGWQAQNWLFSAGMLYRFINEGVEDYHDIKEALKPIKVGKDYEYQHPFWTAKGCLIEKTRFGKFLAKHDYTLYDLKTVKKFLNKVGLKGYEWDEFDCIKFKGSYISEVLGRATLRIPLQGMALFGIMLLPNIYNSDNKAREIIKSLITIICIMGGSSILGSIGKPYGKMPELALMGAGIITGTNLSKKINTNLENYRSFSKDF